MDYFIADTHFYDENIIQYENRPFLTVQEMQEAFFANWNKRVQKTDRVFVLGDWMNEAVREQIEPALFCRLQGERILIRGNHDNSDEAFYYQCGFARVYDFPVIVEDFWILSHEPMYVSANMPYANIYGHVHGNDMYKDYSAHSFCVSAERIHYTPISFEEIKKKILACREKSDA